MYLLERSTSIVFPVDSLSSFFLKKKQKFIYFSNNILGMPPEMFAKYNEYHFFTSI